MTTTLRLLRAAGLSVGLGSAAIGAGYYALFRRSQPRIRGQMALPGLQGTVEVIRDRWGIPHIFAQDRHDLFFALGFVHAQDRLWQMGFNCRTASGTLSEILGEPALEADRLMRRVGLRRAAEREAQRLDPETAAGHEAYCRGVNAFLEQHRGPWPLEFTILRTRQAPWTTADSLVLGRLMGATLAGNWDAEIARSWLIQQVGADAMPDLEPPHPGGMPLVFPAGTESPPPDQQALRRVREAAELAGLGLGGGSNNWVVDGQKSATGMPLLANDPHLTPTMPSIWYQVHLKGDGFDVIGVSIAGLPGIAIGHNDRIAWGITASLTDQQDLFVERVNPENPRQYEYKGQWRDGTIIREEINVRGRAQPVVEEILVTEHGPDIGPCIPGESRTLALKSVVLEEDGLTRAALALMLARNWDEFREAMRIWPSPPQSAVYADVEGNIGYQLIGFVPARKKGLGMVPVPGWTDEYEWDGYVPFDELPCLFNPSTHFAATANAKLVGDDYQHHITNDWIDGFRTRRIVDLLTAKEKHSLEDFQRMHMDCFSIPGRELAPFITDLEPEDPRLREAVRYVRDWDYRLSADSVGGAILECFFYHLYRNTFAHKVGDMLDVYSGVGIHPLIPVSSYGYRAISQLLRVLREARDDWFPPRDGQRTTWSSVITKSLQEAVGFLQERLGDDMSQWRWGRLHQVSFPHPLGQVKPLERIFSRGPYPAHGDQNTILQGAFDPANPFVANVSAVSYRQIVDLADLNRSVAVIPGGQSGQPGNRHYSDLLQRWRRGDYHPLLFDRRAIEAHAEATLVLMPGSAG